MRASFLAGYGTAQPAFDCSLYFQKYRTIEKMDAITALAALAH